MNTWIDCEVQMPPAETNVLALVDGEIRIAALFWEIPGWEDNYEAFLYWDDPDHDGQCWEHHNVTHWRNLPELPTK